MIITRSADKPIQTYGLSREGQQLVADGDYLPLTAEFEREQRARLD